MKYNVNKIAIISDIHTNYLKAEMIISKEDPDLIVFLGDYFDAFGETEQDTDNTALWLKDSLQEKNRIHLIGNHDLSYMTNNSQIKCSGFSEFKKFIIDRHNIPWDKLKTHCYVGDYLCTHAGISKTFFEQYKASNLDEFIKEADDAIKNIDDANITKFFQVGKNRGGLDECGGIFWCDYDEFVDIPGTKQIFGHTRSNHVRQTADHICLDTSLNHYAIYQNNKMTIKQFT